MNGCLAILAHEKAAPTIADFQPRWQRLGLQMIAFVPEGDQWPGAPVDRVVTHGVSAHRGLLVYDRFIHVCETLLTTDYDFFFIIEYDTVNLTDTLPTINAMAVNAGIMETWGAGAEPGQILALSPWIVTRPMLAALIEALKMQLLRPIQAEFVAGLLDRWVGVAIKAARLPYCGVQGCFPWCDAKWDMMKLLTDNKSNLVHGFKRKAQFQHLWPNS